MLWHGRLDLVRLGMTYVGLRLPWRSCVSPLEQLDCTHGCLLRQPNPIFIHQGLNVTSSPPPSFSRPTTTTLPYPFSMASSLPPNGLSSANSSRAHGQANDILQKDAARGNISVHSFNPDASPAEKAAAAGQARSQLTSAIPGQPSDGGRGRPLLYGLAASCRSGSLSCRGPH